MTENLGVFFFVSTVLNFASTVLNFASTVFFFVSTVLKSLGPLKMSLEMAHKVIVPPKKNYIPQFLKQRDINSYKEPGNLFQGINSASLCSLVGRKDNSIPTRVLVPMGIDCLKFQHGK
jgi:hypothetical protein